MKENRLYAQHTDSHRPRKFIRAETSPGGPPESTPDSTFANSPPPTPYLERYGSERPRPQAVPARTPAHRYPFAPNWSPRSTGTDDYARRKNIRVGRCGEVPPPRVPRRSNRGRPSAVRGGGQAIDFRVGFEGSFPGRVRPTSALSNNDTERSSRSNRLQSPLPRP